MFKEERRQVRGPKSRQPWPASGVFAWEWRGRNRADPGNNSGVIESEKWYRFPFFLILREFIYWEKEKAWQREGEGERERERIWSRLPAECRAPCRAWSRDPEIMTWTETKKRRPGWLSYPGAPVPATFDLVLPLITLNLSRTNILLGPNDQCASVLESKSTSCYAIFSHLY